ncbi:MAG TPA: helix-hairpin-helix domain-containing protein, partial [Byssovorax sp.]
FREKQRSSDDVEERLEELRDKLRLPSLPRRIECCDISHLGGGDTVGSIVSLYDGQPDKKHYRSFHVRAKTEGDDYAAMFEVLSRRFRRALKADASPDEPLEVRESTEPRAPASSNVDWNLPDLLVVDGGRGQLQVALSAARDLGLHDLAIVGLAKERETVTGEKEVDRVYLPGQKNGIPLRSTSSALFFLARARDEAHRFANHVRQKLGKKRRMKSELDDVPGIGPQTKASLLRILGSVAAVRVASDEAILAVPGVTKRHLAALRAAFPRAAANEKHAGGA